MTDLGTIRLPHAGWRPRPHQLKLWNYLVNGGKRAVAVWHRRAGKDEICMHAMSLAMFERPGNYWYCLPEFTMGRKAVWDAVNPHSGRKRIDECFPQAMRSQTRDHDMQIRYHNGSTFNVVGSDSVVHGGGIGSSVAAIIFSEFALANPSAWGFYRPILEENSGWAAFISTPRGRNTLFALYEHALSTPGWFAEKLTVDDTKALSPAQIAETLKEYTALYGEDGGRALMEQELYCSWTASTLGAFYALETAAVRNEQRIIECEALADRPVHRAWDLGVGDDTSIWFYQAQGAQIVILDHYASQGVGVEHYRDVINKKYAEHGWLHGDDYVPHDAKVKEWGSGRTRVETMATLGLHPILVPLATLDDGINSVRRILPLCVFHPRAHNGFDALEQYRREWDEDKKTFKPTPLHDWTSHAADAFRYLAMSYKPAPRREVKVPRMDGWRIPPPIENKRGGIRL
jgi:hypothetical protein